MTNKDIIYQKQLELVEDNKLCCSREPDGSIVSIEPIHTLKQWRVLGYRVRKGEEPIAHIDIWRCIPEKRNEDGKVQFRKFMSMSKSAFYKQGQVELKSA